MHSTILSVDDIRRIVARVGLNSLMDQVIENLETVCHDYNAHNFQVPARDGFENGRGGLIEWMPVMHDTNSATVKLVGYHPDNPSQHQLPTILSVAFTLDMHTGHLMSMSDATFATAIRTGAASAVASRILAKPDSETLGLIGAGAQALSQLHALSRVFNFKRVLIHDVSDIVESSFVDRMASIGLSHIEVEHAPPAVVAANSDILCTATSTTPGDPVVFEDADLKPHLHVNAVGSDFPGKVELPFSFLKRSFVAVDFLQQALKEGECQRLQSNEVGPDLIELVHGASQFSANRLRSTTFDSTGFALEDHVVISVLHSNAREFGYGTTFEIETSSTDPTNPYAFLNETTMFETVIKDSGQPQPNTNTSTSSAGRGRPPNNKE